MSSALTSLQAAVVAWIIRCSRYLQPAPISPGPTGGRGRFAALIKHRPSLRRRKLQKNGMCDQGRNAAQGHLSKRCAFIFPSQIYPLTLEWVFHAFILLLSRSLVNIHTLLGWFKVNKSQLLVRFFMFLWRLQMLS